MSSRNGAYNKQRVTPITQSEEERLELIAELLVDMITQELAEEAVCVVS